MLVGPYWLDMQGGSCIVTHSETGVHACIYRQCALLIIGTALQQLACNGTYVAVSSYAIVPACWEDMVHCAPFPRLHYQSNKQCKR
jgi:hypothetical protein